MEIMKEMAKIVDEQNKNDKNYIKMSDDFEKSLAKKIQLTPLGALFADWIMIFMHNNAKL